MKKNMSKKEQIIRIIIGVVSGVVAILIPFYYLFILTGLMFLTGASGYCPLYNLCPFKKTCAIKEDKENKEA